MTVSSKVKSVLAFFGKRQIELAEYFGMGKQSMNNKMARDSWSAKDVAKVAEFVGCKVAFILPDGQYVLIDADEETKDPGD
ncbi:MAG: helix-turn-helix domain-containing protein [Clostridia bacterium]